MSTRAAPAFFADAEQPALKRPYTAGEYQPMIELLRCLEAQAFSAFIASGGHREYSEEVGLVYRDGVANFDDGPEKPVRIWSRTEQRTALAAGNSNGDIPMLRFADGLRLLVLHHDAEREFAYTAGAETALAAGFVTVSVADDWATVFADVA